MRVMARVASGSTSMLCRFADSSRRDDRATCRVDRSSESHGRRKSNAPIRRVARDGALRSRSPSSGSAPQPARAGECRVQSLAVTDAGELDRAALQRTLSEIVRRHESLRTVFPSVDGTPGQVVQPAGDVALSVTDLDASDVAGIDAEVARVTRKEAARSFDLENGPLFRALLVRITPRDHLLVLTMHHIVSDGWSRGVLYREIGALYEAFAAGRPSPLSELPIQYADYAQWQREWLQEDVLSEQAAYWSKQLAGSLPKLDLPTDRPRPSVQTFRGATHTFALPAELVDALRSVSASVARRSS